MDKSHKPEQRESLEDETRAILEEARMVLPGVQALLGFQLVAVFNARFEDLPSELQIVHLVALIAVAVSMSLVMSPEISPNCRARSHIDKIRRDCFVVHCCSDGSVGIEDRLGDFRCRYGNRGKFSRRGNHRSVTCGDICRNVVRLANDRRASTTALNAMAGASPGKGDEHTAHSQAAYCGTEK